jgi:hypothetical protein
MTHLTLNPKKVKAANNVYNSYPGASSFWLS